MKTGKQIAIVFAGKRKIILNVEFLFGRAKFSNPPAGRKIYAYPANKTDKAAD